VNIALAIMYIYPFADSLRHFRVEEANGVQTIAEWFLADPQPSQEELESAWRECLRGRKLKELNIACQSTILGGFTGTNGHQYQFESKDQDNFSQQLTLLLLDPTIATVDWKTMDAGIITHTRDEFISLANDANNHKRSNMGKYWTFEAQLELASTEEEINSLVW
jgi:hypothetical protein